MATRTEQLDELLAMSREVGSLWAKASAAAHRADMGPAGRGSRSAREARELRALAESRQEQLATMRAKFLAALGAES